MTKPVVEKLVVGTMATNCYIVISKTTPEALVVDPGDDPEYIIDKLTTHKVKPSMIVATHGHFDHIMGARALQLAYNIPFAINEKDVFLVENMQSSAQHFLGITPDPPPVVSRILQDGEVIKVGSIELKILKSSGHTPGSICLSLPSENMLFVGDTMFADGALGRTDFSYSRKSDLDASVKNILAFPSETKLHPGHGESFTIDLWPSQ